MGGVLHKFATLKLHDYLPIRNPIQKRSQSVIFLFKWNPNTVKEHAKLELSLLVFYSNPIPIQIRCSSLNTYEHSTKGSSLNRISKVGSANLATFFYLTVWFKRTSSHWWKKKPRRLKRSGFFLMRLSLPEGNVRSGQGKWYGMTISSQQRIKLVITKSINNHWISQ